MRFMIIVKANSDTEAGAMPEESMLKVMGEFHEELVASGVLLDASGLRPSSQGFRVQYSGGKPAVIDGPFAETKELIAGYTLIQVKSKDEAIEWAKRFPNPHGTTDCHIEVRQLYELEDFGPSAAVEQMREQVFAKIK